MDSESPIPSPPDESYALKYFKNELLGSSFPSHYTNGRHSLSILLEIYCRESSKKGEYLPTNRLKHLVEFASCLKGPILKEPHGTGMASYEIWCKKFDETTDTDIGSLFTTLTYERLVSLRDDAPYQKFRCNEAVFWFAPRPALTDPHDSYDLMMLGLYQDMWQIGLERIHGDSFFRVTVPSFEEWCQGECKGVEWTAEASKNIAKTHDKVCELRQIVDWKLYSKEYRKLVDSVSKSKSKSRKSHRPTKFGPATVIKPC